jgi:hypothetical protein
MSAPSVKIRIGGALDGSLDRALQQAQQKIGQGEKAVQRQKKQTTQAVEQEAAKQLKAQERLAKAVEQLDRQRSRGLFQQFRAQEAATERAAKAQERATARAHAAERREIDKTARAAARALAEEQRKKDAAARQAQRHATRQGESFARRTSHRASRFLMPEAPLGAMAMRALGGVARGAGIDFSIQGAVGRSVGLESAATDLSNSGYQAGNAGPNGKRVDPGALVKQSRAVGGDLGIDAMEVLSGLTQFQKITGDLNTGRELLRDMARLAKATGTDLGDMAAAAANVSNGLGDTPDKAKILDQVMRTIAGQGKLGAVEISDMAVQMARVAASASKFAGDRGENIAKMGALAQIARAEGGAPSAAESARSVGGFAATLQKGARIKAFQKKGIDVFSDKSKTQFKDPIELIKESLTATGGNLEEMNKLFMDVIGARAVGGLQKTFVGAGGGDVGLKKVDEQISRMLKAQVSKEEVDESAKRASDTTAAKAARFQNDLDSVTDGIMVELVPALERGSEDIIKFAKIAGQAATWMVTHPKAAIGGAISLAIARAGLESAFRSGIERLIVGPNSSRAGAVGKAATAIGGVMTIAAITASVITAASIYAEQMYDQSSQDFTSGTGKGDAADRLTKQIQAAIEAKDFKTAEKLTKQQIKLREDAANDISNSENFTGADKFWDELARGAVKTFIPGGEKQLAQSDEEVKALAREQLAAATRSQALLAEIRDNIQITPPPGENSGTGRRVSQ